MDKMKILMFVLANISTIAVYVIVQRILSPAKKKESNVTDLVAPRAQDSSSFAKLDPNKSIIDKMDLFFAKKMKYETKLEEMYMLLGKPSNLSPIKMLHQKEFFALAAAVLFVLMTHKLFLIPAGLVVGFLVPDLMFAKRIKKRQIEILKNFPTVVDLAALTIESGMDYITAFDRIVKITPQKTELEIEVDKMLNEIQLGYSRRDALQRFAQRTGLQEIRSFVGLIVQSDELGTSLVDLLRNFATDLRFKRLNKAEQLAAQASTKMLIPLFLFIFPTVFILILSPMIADLLKGGLPF
jgi:tight adherence protein C